MDLLERLKDRGPPRLRERPAELKGPKPKGGLRGRLEQCSRYHIRSAS